jgi:hypothetical protein
LVAVNEFHPSLQARIVLVRSCPTHGRPHRCPSFPSSLTVTMNAAMKCRTILPTPSKLLSRLTSPRRFFPIISVRSKYWKTIHSASVKATARSSIRYRGIRSASNTSKAIVRMDLNPYEYTSGRWLHRSKDQNEARHIKFDYDALCRKIVEQCPGSQRIVECEKIEGGFNRVFLFTMDDKQTLIARLPFSHAGPPRLITQSEVATTAYGRLYSHIPLFSPLFS